MSLVQVVLTDEFVLVGAEMRAVSDNVIIDNANKLVKINENIIVGCTGNVNDNLELFSDFISLDRYNGLYENEQSKNVSYIDFLTVMQTKFNQLKKAHNDKKNPKRYDIQSVICGRYMGELSVFLFDLSYRTNGQDIIRLSLPIFPRRVICTAGNPRHYDNLKSCIEILNPKTLEEYKMAMNTVFSMGVKFDETINNVSRFEVIRKV